MTPKVEAFFLPAPGGQRFCIHYSPADVRATILYIHPFAEEMNKSRRMAALQSRLLAGAGYAVLQIDLAGCGDSSGEFGDATWQDWIDDVVLGARWLRERWNVPMWLWGLRSGCLLSTAAALELGQACNLLFWQPSTSGRSVLHQFLRLTTASLLVEGRPKGSTLALRQRLEAGERVQVAGYGISPGLALGLEQATLTVPARAGRIECLEVSSRAGATASPATKALVDQWRAAGLRIRDQMVDGPPFWQTVEIDEAPALLEATRNAIEQEPAP